MSEASDSGQSARAEPQHHQVPASNQENQEPTNAHASKQEAGQFTPPEPVATVVKAQEEDHPSRLNRASEEPFNNQAEGAPSSGTGTQLQELPEQQPEHNPEQQPEHSQDSPFTSASHRPFQGMEFYHHHPSKTSPVPTGTLAVSLRASLTRSYSQIYITRRSQELPSHALPSGNSPNAPHAPTAPHSRDSRDELLDQLLPAPAAGVELRMITPPPLVLSDEAIQQLEEQETAIEAELAAQAAEADEKIAQEVDDMGKALDRALDQALLEMQNLPDVPASYQGDGLTAPATPLDINQPELPAAAHDDTAAPAPVLDVPDVDIDTKQAASAAEEAVALHPDEASVMLDLPRVDSEELMRQAAALDSPMANFSRLTPDTNQGDVTSAPGAASSDEYAHTISMTAPAPQVEAIAGGQTEAGIAVDAQDAQQGEPAFDSFQQAISTTVAGQTLPATPLLDLSRATPDAQPVIQEQDTVPTRLEQADDMAGQQQTYDAFDDTDASVLVREDTFTFSEEQQARSKAISEQLAKLQEESRRLQEQSRALQERATAIQREALLTGVPVPAGWLAANASIGVLSGAEQAKQREPVVRSPKKQPRAAPVPQAPSKVQQPVAASPSAAPSAPSNPPARQQASIPSSSDSTQPKAMVPPAQPINTKPSLNWGLPLKKAPGGAAFGLHGASPAVPPPLPSKSPDVPLSSYSQVMKTYAPGPTANGNPGTWALNREGSSSSTVESLLPRWSDQVSSTAVSPLASPDRYQRYNSPLKTHPSPESKLRLQAAAARHQAQVQATVHQQHVPPEQPPPLLSYRQPGGPQAQGKPAKVQYQPVPMLGGYPQPQLLMKQGPAAASVPNMGAPTMAGGGADQASAPKARKFLPEVKLTSMMQAQQAFKAPPPGSKAPSTQTVTWAAGSNLNMPVHPHDNVYQQAPPPLGLANHSHAAPWQPAPVQYPNGGLAPYGAAMYMPHSMEPPRETGLTIAKPIPHKPGPNSKHPKSGRLRMGATQAAAGGASQVSQPFSFYPQDPAYQAHILPPIYAQQAFQGMPGYAPQHQGMYGQPGPRAAVPHSHAAALHAGYSNQQQFGDPWAQPGQHLPAAAPYHGPIGMFGMMGAPAGGYGGLGAVGPYQVPAAPNQMVVGQPGRLRGYGGEQTDVAGPKAAAAAARSAKASGQTGGKPTFKVF